MVRSIIRAFLGLVVAIMVGVMSYGLLPSEAASQVCVKKHSLAGTCDTACSITKDCPCTCVED